MNERPRGDLAPSEPRQELERVNETGHLGIFSVVEIEREKIDLQAWLERDGNMELVLKEPLAIHLYNWLPAEYGGPVENVAWYPLVRRLGANGVYSEMSYHPHRGLFPLFSESELREAEKSELIELVALSRTGPEFSHLDLLPEALRLRYGESEFVGIGYRIRPERASAYSDWTGDHVGHLMAHTLDGYCMGYATLMSRLGSNCVIGFGRTEDSQERIQSAIEAIRGAIGRAGEHGLREDPLAGYLVTRYSNEGRFILAWARILMTSTSPSDRIESARWIGQFRKEATPCVPYLLESLMQTSENELVLEIIESLRKIGAGASNAIPDLRSTMNSDDKTKAGRAREALRAIRGS